MKALWWHGKGDVRYEALPDLQIEDARDAIVRNTSTAICGSAPAFDSIPVPTSLGTLREARIGLDLARGLLQLPLALRAPRGSRDPVALLPGFYAGDTSLWLMRNYLLGLGWDAEGWGLGLNRGDARALLPRVIEMVERRAAAAGKRVHLVGWSMGGFLAREVARDRPDLAAQVITLGTPVVGGPRYTALAELFRARGYDMQEIETECERRAVQPIQAPVLAIYSRRDSVVAWQACVDRTSPSVEHVEVASTHVGLGFDLRVWRIIADRLRQVQELERQRESHAARGRIEDAA